jgi:hypothetical protein
MTRQVETWKPATVAHYPTLASCIYINGDAFLALALKAYLAASKKMVPPDGGRWCTEGDPWGSAQDFYDALTFEIAERLRVSALRAGHLSERPWNEAEEERLVAEFSGAGQSPAVTAPVPADRLYAVARRA